MRRLAGMASFAALILAACAPAEPPPMPAPGPQPTPSLPATAPSSTPKPPPAPVAVAPGPSSDQCGAKALQYLVGKPRSEIPVPANPARRRVACTTCPVTMDFNPERQNIFFDAATGVIKEVRCG